MSKKVVILKILKDGKAFATKEVAEDRFVIGTSSTEAQVILEGDASPVHASIEKRDGKHVLCDLGSEKGTYKNGDKILEADLKPGDSITLGEFNIEFSLGEATAQPVASAPAKSSGTSVSAVASAAAAGGGVSVGVGRSKKTFAPASPHKNINEFVRPTKGTLVEVLVAWKERVISAYHFSERGTINVGTHPSCDVIVPLISTSVNKAPLIQLDNQAVIILHPGMEGILVSDKEAIPFSDLAKKGRASNNYVPLNQGEMARIKLGGDVELVVRYASQAPKPLIIPFFDLSSNGFLAVLLAIILTGILALYVSLNVLDKIDKEDEDEYRTALIITNPPKPPPRVKIKPPPKEKPKKVKKKIVKVKPKKKKIKVKMTKSKKRNRTKQGQSARAAGAKKDRTAKALRANPNKPKSKKAGSVKKGGAVKTAKKQGAQANSERKLKKSGIFSAFGSGGRNDRIDTSYAGGGELAGLADQATGTAGFAEDRPGKGLGSKFKETGGGLGKSNVGVSGIKKSGNGMGAGGFGSSGLGDRKAVSIIPGGGGEEFSGSIDKEGIRKVFFDNARAIRSCYERQLIKNPNLGGKLMLNFDIGEHGRVVGRPSVNWGTSTMSGANSRSVANCVLLRLKTWRFPEPPRNQVVNVIYPLAFSAK